MHDLSQIAGFDWDEGNNLKSADKHSVSQIEAEQVFADSRLLIVDDVKHSQDEVRYHALGRTIDNRLLHVTFTFRAGSLNQFPVFAAKPRNESSGKDMIPRTTWTGAKLSVCNSPISSFPQPPFRSACREDCSIASRSPPTSAMCPINH
jgi:uncharacterized DUF497 family protein